MPKYHGSIPVACEDNQRRQCKCPGCTERRWRISGYCQDHSRKVQAWGSPLGADIHDSQLTIAFDLMEKVIAANPHHKGIIAACEFFDKWMIMGHATKGMRPQMVPTSRHLARLKDFEVVPLDCLKVIGSVYLFAHIDRTKLIKNDQHLRALMVQKLFDMAPMRGERQKTGKERKAAGRYIEKNIGPLLVTLIDAVERMERLEQERLRDLTSELEIPVPSEAPQYNQYRKETAVK